MNLHAPERQPHETKAQYRKRSEASRATAERQTNPERFMPVNVMGTHRRFSVGAWWRQFR